jgi:drug/metabolite transporter (DMT)-like permease
MLAGIIALGFSAIFVRWANAPAPIMAMYRMGVAVLFLTPVYAYNNQKSRPAKKIYLLVPVLGGIVTALDHFFINTALESTTAANATLLGTTSPLWVALVASLVFKERLGKAFWTGLALTLSGAALVMGYDFILHPSLGWGDLLALTSGVMYAGYFLITQAGRSRLDTLTYVWLVEISAVAVLFLMSLMLGLPLTGYPIKTYLAFIGAGLFSQTVGYLSMSYALGHLPASAVAPTMIGQPVVTALLAIPILGELLQPVQWIGGAVVLLGIYLVNRSHEKTAVR